MAFADVVFYNKLVIFVLAKSSACEVLILCMCAFLMCSTFCEFFSIKVL